MRIFYMILVIVFSLFIVTFSQQNLTTVQLHYNILDYKLLNNLKPVPVYLLIFISILIGVIITGFWGTVERFRLNRTIRNLNRLVRDLRKELNARENPPIINEQLPKK
ncbi:MAG TPA: LapA family protein [Smithella sp.]|nr:LapA family protein [Smithella sp.]MDM7986078.1 LapA family protein [Smithella sp.]HNY49025.1 LapA family protein [Smithella sp.]HOG90008.1 LapA family protein [Smithella sp.]HOU51913.1 LapA family protein [Smithella sp.]